MEVVEVGNAARLLCSIVEQGETVAAEVGPVVVHLQGVAETFPVFAVEAVAEGGLVCEVGEVALYAQPNPPLLLEGQEEALNLLAYGVALIHRFLHNDIELAALVLHAHEAVAVLEAGKTCHVAVLQPREVHQHLALTGGAIDALGERVAGLADVLDDGGGLQSQPAFTLGEAPGVHVGHVVPLPYGFQPALLLVT